MRRPFTSAIFAVALLTPVIGFATYTKASDIFGIFRTQDSAWDSSAEVHGHFEQYWFSAWIAGSSQGKDPQTAKSTMNITFDVAGGPLYVRTKAHVRVVEGNAYVFIDSIDGKYDDPIARIAGELNTKKWLKLPIEDIAQEVPTESDLTELDELFDLRPSAVSGGGTEYTITFKREFLREMLQQLRQTNEVSEMRTQPSITFFLRTNTDANGRILSTSIDSGVAASEFGITVTGKATARSAAVSVEVPTDAVDLKTLGNSFPVFSPYMPFEQYEWEDGNWSSESSSEEWWGSSSSWEWGSSSSEEEWDDWTDDDMGGAESDGQGSASLPSCYEQPSLIKRGLCEFEKH